MKRSVAVGLASCALLAGAAAAWWAPSRLTPPRPAAAPPSSAPQASLPLSKEYVYAGGRLVATEEPPAGAPPTGLVATASSQTAVALTWAAPAAGTVTGYVVERRESAGGNPTHLTTGSTATAFTDQSQVAAKTAYLYRVRAVFADGGASGYSNADLATTVVFDDDPLVAAGNQAGATPTRVAAKHLTQLREAVDAVRVLIPGLGAVAWKNDPGPASGGLVLPAHFKELRTNLNPALTALGLGQLTVNDAAFTKGQPVRAAHVQEVRDRVR